MVLEVCVLGRYSSFCVRVGNPAKATHYNEISTKYVFLEEKLEIKLKEAHD